MKVAWIHNFDTKQNENAGVFMYQILELIKSKDIVVEEFYTGKITLFTIVPIILRLRRLTESYDIVHAQYGSGCGLITSFLLGKKVLSLRGSDWYISPHNSIKSYLHTRLAILMSRISIKRFDSIITMSERMSEDVKERYPKAQVNTIIDGIDINRFDIKGKDVARRSLGASDDNPWVLFSSVAQGNILKRYNLAVEAINIAKRQMPNLELKFMNNVPHVNVPNFVNSCNLVLLTSTHEGWPNIIKEGLACNLPFVSTDVSDLKLIANQEESCTVIREESEEVMTNSLAQGIIKAINYSTEKLTLRKYAMQMSLDNNVEELLCLYKTLLELDLRR